MTSKEVMKELRKMGSENIKKILLRHGVKEPFFGVKVGDLKTLEKKIKTNGALAKELYATGNADAMYLAGLIADDDKMTKAELQNWATLATSQNISEYTVPWVATGNKNGFDLALGWIDSKEEHIVASGWATLSNIVSLKNDDELDLDTLKRLLVRAEETVRSSSDRVIHTMNGFIIAIGIYVTDLTNQALSTAKNIGPIFYDLNGTACKIPLASEAIIKAKTKGVLGKKKKKVKC